MMSINVKIAIIYTPIGLDNKKNLWLVLNNKKIFGCLAALKGLNQLSYLRYQTINSASSSNFHHLALLVALVSHSSNFHQWPLLALLVALVLH